MAEHYLWNVKGKHIKKYIITFLCFLAAVSFVIALAVLITGSRADLWVTGNNGVARESMFPFVYTVDKALYVLNSDLSVNPVDDKVENPVHDTEFEKVYYTRENVMYEYTIGSNTRKVLCGDVDSFYVFKERKSIVFTTNSGSVCLYKFTGSEIITLFDATLEENSTTSLISTAKGASLFAFLLANGADAQYGTLYLLDLNGNLKTISEEVNYSEDIDILSNDNAISYYKGNSLVIQSLNSSSMIEFNDGCFVKQQENPFDVDLCTPVESYDSFSTYAYILHDISPETGLGTLSYINIGQFLVSSKQISANVNSVIGFNPETLTVLYSETKGDNVSVYSSQKGGSPKQITTEESSASLYFDSDTSTLFIKNTDNVLFIIDINNSRLSKNIIAYDVDTVYPYAEQDMVVIRYVDSDSKSILISNNRIDTFSAFEDRLFGKYNNKYLMLRYNANAFSLDYVKDGEMTRISGVCSRSVFFDKNIEYVLYIENGILKCWSNFETSDIQTLSADTIQAVKVLSSK